MKLITLSLVAALAVNTAFAGGDFVEVEPVVEAPVVVEESALEISANLAITSNYVWRGVTQTHNSPAVQGGIDLGYEGFYLGTWGSNVEFGPSNNNLEADFYAGYAGEINGLGYDLGYIYYAYPNESDAFNFDEVYVGLSYDWDSFGISGKYSVAVESNLETDDYWEVGATAKLPMDTTLAVGFGETVEDTWGSHYLVSLTKPFGKFEVSVAYIDFSAHNNVGLEDNDYIVGTLSTSF